MQSAWNKHGESDFEFSVLEFCDNDNKKERKDFYIKKLKTNEYSIGYNLKTFENETIVTGVYMIMDIIEEKKYIGSSLNIRSRCASHRSSLRRGFHENCKLQEAWNSKSELNFIFEIVESCSEEFLRDREQYFIDFYETTNSQFGFNIYPAEMLGRKNPESTRQKISIATKQAMATEKVKNNVSKAQKKRFSNPEEKIRIRNIINPILRSEKCRSENSERLKAFWQNEEFVKKQKETRAIIFSKPEARAKMKEISIKMWNDPEKYKNTLEKRSNVTKEQVAQILNFTDSGLSYRQIAEKVGGNRHIVGRICRGENKFATL